MPPDTAAVYSVLVEFMIPGLQSCTSSHSVQQNVQVRAVIRADGQVQALTGASMPTKCRQLSSHAGQALHVSPDCKTHSVQHCENAIIRLPRCVVDRKYLLQAPLHHSRERT